MEAILNGETPPPSSVYAIVDTESGGLDTESRGLVPRTTALLQVSIIIVDKDLNELDTFAHRIIPHPNYEIQPIAAQINGYDEAEWVRTGMSWTHADSAYTQYLKQWFGDRKAVGVAHNAQHDVKFVRLHMPNTFDLFLDPWFCTCNALRKWRSRTKVAGNNKLASLAELAGFVHTGTDKAHDALGDTKACLAGLRWLLKQSQQAQVKQA